uniref:acyl carrier protein n=1 Tax=Castellaniella defragrans TaxID=75697 RepID=UPI003340A066
MTTTMQTLPDTPILREKLAAIIARTSRCEPEPLLEDQEFASVIAQFDSLAILEILLEIETEYGLTTDEMLPTHHDVGAQEFTSVFPKNISALIIYMHEVMNRRVVEPQTTESADAARKEAAPETAAPPAGQGGAEISGNAAQQDARSGKDAEFLQ